jgi:hypothetical protein
MKNTHRPLIGITFLIFSILACSQAATPVANATIPPVQFFTFTPAPTLAVTDTPAFTPTPAGKVYAWNDLAEIDGGGVKIKIARLILGEKAAIDQPFSKIKTFDDRPVVAAIIFVIQNSSTTKASVYPDQGTLVAGGEQIDLSEFMLLGTFGDRLGGEIFPGVTKVGGIWLGFKRTAIDTIQSILISIHAPVDDRFNQIGGEYQFNLDLSQRKNDPLPEYLKSLK